MRLAGFASGMDINQMVRDLMRAERIPQEQLVQEQTFKNWQVDAYRELNTQIRAFEQSLFDRLLTPSRFLARTGASTNSELVSVTSSSGVENSQYTISNVRQLARGASTHSTSAISTAQEEFSAAMPLKDVNGLAWESGTVRSEMMRGDGETLSFTFAEEDNLNTRHPMIVRVDGQVYEVVESTEELGEGKVQLDMNGAEHTLIFAEPVQNSARIEVQYVDGEEGQFMFAAAESYGADGSAIRHEGFITEEDTLQNVLNEFNHSDLGLNAFYDEFSDQVAVSRTETGVFNPNGSNEMVFEGAFFTEFLKLDNEREQGAQNAVFVVNGLETERQSNTFTFGNLTMTLQRDFAEEVTLSSTVDTDAIVDNVRNFVDEYNALIADVHGKLGERRYRDYPPLTDEQRSEMSDHEIELWEEKAQSGLLNGDRQLSQYIGQMRTILYQTVEVEGSSLRHLSDLGITTSNDYLEKGKLEIDEDALRAAVENDPEGVYGFFSQTGAETGIGRNLRGAVREMSDSVSQQAGGASGRYQNHQFSLGRELHQLDDRIESFERRLERVEQRYWRQFTAMERAMSAANQQSEMLYNFMFGNGN